MTGLNAWVDKEWPASDRASLLREVRGWQETWRRGEPCPECGWPFPGAPYHLHDLSKTQRGGPVRDD